MKKLLSVILMLALIFSLGALAGCSKEDTPDTGTPNTGTGTPDASTGDGEMTKEELESTLPGEYLIEKCNAGIEVSVQFTGFVDNDAIMTDYAGAVEALVTGYGATFHKTHAGGDVTEMITQIENFTEMGTNMIVMVPPDGATLKDVVMKAQETGIAVISYGAADADYCLNTYGDQRTLGYLTAEMAYTWISEKHPDAAPGSIEVGVIASTAIQPMVENAAGIVESVESHDILNMVFYTDACEGTIDSGFNLAETACTANPDLRYLIVQTSNPGVGANNYVMSQSGIDPEEWGVFTATLEGPVLETMELASDGSSVVRGTVAGVKSEGEYICSVVDDAFHGKIAAPYELLIEYNCLTMSGWDCPLGNSDVPPAA